MHKSTVRFPSNRFIVCDVFFLFFWSIIIIIFVTVLQLKWNKLAKSVKNIGEIDINYVYVPVFKQQLQIKLFSERIFLCQNNIAATFHFFQWLFQLNFPTLMFLFHLSLEINNQKAQEFFWLHLFIWSSEIGN